MLITAVLCLTATADAKKKTIVKECWPNGEMVAEWFRDTTKVDVGQLGKRYVLTDFAFQDIDCRDYAKEKAFTKRPVEGLTLKDVKINGESIE